MQHIVMKNRIKSLFTRFVAFMLACSTFLYVMFGNVQPVKAVTIESLPADIDIKVDSDSDYVSFEYEGIYYQIDRDFTTTDEDGYKYVVPHYNGVKSFLRLKYTDFGYRNSNYINDISCNPISLERDASNNLLKCSYWFSPSEMKVYALTHSRSYNDDTMSFILGYNSGSFNVQGNRSTVITTTVIDLSDNDINYSDLKHGIMDIYADVNSSKFSHSGYYLNKFTFKTISSLPSGFDCNTSQYSACYSLSDAEYYEYPDDLVCIDSNYLISGFYEPGTDEVKTPDYYFAHQYLFYLKDFGFTFIDSSVVLTDISFPSSDNIAKYLFDNVGNVRVYKSTNGTVWNELTNVVSMYTDNFTVDYGMLCKGQYQLLWSNDNSYDDNPLIPPEYGTITDITSDLDSLLDEFNRVELPSGDELTEGILPDINSICIEHSEGTEITRFLSSSLAYDTVKYAIYYNVMYGYRHCYIFSDTVPPCYFEEFNSDAVTVNLSFPYVLGFSWNISDVEYHEFNLVEDSVVELSTLGMYNRLMSNSLNNIDKQLGALRFDIHSDLRSLFDNISFMNLYVQKLITSVSDVEYAVTLAGNRLLTTNGFLKDIRNSLGTIDLSIGNGLLSDISGKLDTIISNMGNGSSSSGGGVVVGSDLTDVVVNIKDLLSDKLDADWLLSDDDNDLDGFVDDFGPLVQNIATTGVITSYFENSLIKINGYVDLTDAVGMINGFVDDIVGNMGMYSAAVFLPPAMGLVNLVMRKERL